MTSARESKLRVGLTGARGVLGGSLQRDCPDVGWIPFDGDVTDFARVQDWMKQNTCDAIVHLAAIVPIGKVESEPLHAFQTNVGGTCNLLEAICQRAHSDGSPWIFVASSSHVYVSQEKPLQEDSPTAPVSLYGLTKLQAEQWALAFAEKFGLKVCVGRIFSFSSARQAESYFIPGLLKKISHAQPNAVLQLPGLDGTRDFLTTDQISRAIRFLMERRATGVFNVASGKPTRLMDIAQRIRQKLNREDVRIETAAGSPPVHLKADVMKLRGLGLELQFDLDRLLDEMLAAKRA